MRVGMGWKARTGRAVLVALGGEVQDPSVVERVTLPLLPAGAFAPYHAAADLDAAAARESVRRSIAIAHDLAKRGIQRAAQRLTAGGHSLCGCAVLVGNGMPEWSTEEILAVHVRMHMAEGELFRDVLVAGARACGLAVTTLRDKAALDDATAALGWTHADLQARLVALGKAAGPPWGKDQKEAAAAALVALAMFAGAARRPRAAGRRVGG